MVDPPPARSRAGVLFMVAPVVFLSVIALAFGGLVLMVRSGGVADGSRVQATLSTACPAEAAGVLSRRMTAVGLGDPSAEVAGGDALLTMTLPAEEANPQTIPRMLARQGLLQLTNPAGEVLANNAHVTGTGVEMDRAGMPTTMVLLNGDGRAALEAAVAASQEVVLTMDGEEVARFSRFPDLDDGYLEIPSGEGITAVRMRVAADRSILLGSGPLPCPAWVTQVVPVQVSG